MSASSRIKTFLGNTRPSVFNSYCMIAAFTTYFCMYAFRKPFSVGRFEGAFDLPLVGEVDLKIMLIISQVFGYTCSKFLGIKVISEMEPHRRALSILVMIGMAELALVGFAVTPSPYNVAFLFLNGLPLGMIWGLVFGFLEGRKSSELLGAGLSASYIVASGAVKSVGKWILDLGYSENWMPVIAGLLFAPLLVVAVYFLKQIPSPTAEDERLRMHRGPMHKSQRREFFGRFAPGLVSLTLLYMLLTAYRDFRDNFAREIWDAVGYGEQPAVFTIAELPIALFVLVALALLMRIRTNSLAVSAIHGIMFLGTAMIGLATLGFQSGLISPLWWMIMVGLGCYLAYVPYGCVLFDRLLASLGVVGTAGFMIYATDAFGYLGSVFLLLYKNFGQPDLSWLGFFIGFSYVASIICCGCFAYSWLYFRRHASHDV